MSGCGIGSGPPRPSLCTTRCRWQRSASNFESRFGAHERPPPLCSAHFGPFLGRPPPPPPPVDPERPRTDDPRTVPRRRPSSSPCMFRMHPLRSQRRPGVDRRHLRRLRLRGVRRGARPRASLRWLGWWPSCGASQRASQRSAHPNAALAPMQLMSRRRSCPSAARRTRSCSSSRLPALQSAGARAFRQHPGPRSSRVAERGWGRARRSATSGGELGHGVADHMPPSQHMPWRRRAKVRIVAAR